MFDFDGTIYVGDLPVLAYARHSADQLGEAAATDLIDGIRFFLEGRSVRDADAGLRVDLGVAQDGFQAVEILADNMGLTDRQIGTAYRQARLDLGRTAFALDPPEGLIELLTELAGVHVMVVTNADSAGVTEVLTAIGLAGHIDDVITDAGKPGSMPRIIADTLRRIGAVDAPTRLMAIGDRWTEDLAEAHLAGACTALVDRFGRGDGTPTARAADLAGLLPAIQRWAGARRALSGSTGV